MNSTLGLRFGAFLRLALMCVTLLSNSAAEENLNQNHKPNIVLILTDDLDFSIGGMVSYFHLFIISAEGTNYKTALFSSGFF